MFILQELKKEAESARLVMQAKMELEESTQRKNLIQSEIDGLLIKIKPLQQKMFITTKKIVAITSKLLQ